MDARIRKHSPFALHVAVGRGEFVFLVTPQSTQHANHCAGSGADKILIAAAILVQHIGRHAHRHITPIARLHKTRIYAVIIAIKINHAAGESSRRLRSHRDRLKLPHRALAGVRHQFHRLLGIELVIDAHTALRLLNVFARVELQRQRIDLSRVGVELRLGQAQRILRTGQIDVIAKHGHRGCLTQAHVKLGICAEPNRGAVRSRPVGLKTIHLRDIAHSALTAISLKPDAQRIVRTGNNGRSHRRRRHAGLSEYLNHPTGRVAVQRRERPAQHLDPLRAA